MDKELITSVLGFDLNADIRDEADQLIPVGIKKTIYPVSMMERINYRIIDKGFFTHYNEALLAKIRDFRRLND
jgi:hypothetical protein